MADTPINPKALVCEGAIVSASNPLRCVAVATPTPGTDVTINPTTFVWHGFIVSNDDPLPITFD